MIGTPNLGLAYATSFLLGFSDACFNTQVADGDEKGGNHDDDESDDDDDHTDWGQ